MYSVIYITEGLLQLPDTKCSKITWTACAVFQCAIQSRQYCLTDTITYLNKLIPNKSIYFGEKQLKAFFIC